MGTAREYEEALMSYVEVLLCYLLLVGGIVGGVSWMIGKYIWSKRKGREDEID